MSDGTRDSRPGARARRPARWGLVMALVLAISACTSGGGRPAGSGGPSSPGPSAPGPSASVPSGSGPSSSEPGAGTSGGTSPSGVPGEDAAGNAGALAAFFGRDLALTRHGAFGWRRITVLPASGPGASPSLRVRYPADSASQRATTDGGSDGGAQAYLTRRSGPLDEAWLAYDVRFQSGFNFVKGGKLPGLYGGTVTSGQHIPDGTDGFSTRYMWRTSGAGEVYAYLPTSRDHGTSIGRGDWTWPAGHWVQVVQHVRLNTPGRADGVVDVWFQGQQVLHRADLTYRTTGDLKIEGVFFSSFFGGGDSTWATPTDQYADFAAVRLSTSPISCLAL